MKRKFLLTWSFAFALCLAFTGAIAAQQTEQKPIILKTMGSLFFGGTVSKSANGETFHGDHGYAQYYIPQNARDYPLIMWHGIGQSGKTYESTPDGREGFQAILTRRDWPVYIIDQPRRGRAGRTQAGPHTSLPPVLRAENYAWEAFRLGIWTPPKGADFYPGIQFPRDGYSLDQFMRQQTPDTGEEPRTPEYRAFMGHTMAALFAATGPGVLITHSNSGQYGWETALAAPDLVRAIVAYEPGAFIFPEGETLEDIPGNHPALVEAYRPRTIPLEEFKKLTKMPIIIIYGDNVPQEPFEVSTVDLWRFASIRARQFVDAVNRNGGDAQLVMLPDIGIKGNSHFPFADLNSLEIAAHLESWLQSKGLAGRGNPHTGPALKKLDAVTIPLKP